VETRWQRDGTNFAYAVDAFNNVIASPDGLGLFFRKPDTPSAGAHTYGFRNNGTASMTYVASTNSPAVLTIWEKGGA
jgi:hypothetical protein